MANNRSKKVVLIQGGMGAERAVSLVTGKGFAAALTELGYQFEVIDAGPDLQSQLLKVKADVALLALHGKYAEDGIVQGICEYMKLPYSGSGVLASALCMDKILTKQVLLNANIPTAKHVLADTKKTKTADIPVPDLGWPLVVKPSREGSSVGVSIVKDQSGFRKAIEEAAKYDHMILMEQYIAGMELTVPILQGKPLTPIEIVPKLDFYTYENKYTAGATDYIMPARASAKTLEAAKKIAVQAFDVLRLRTYGRIDFRIDTEGNPFVMEMNTLPGCTPTSLFPKAARHDGIDFNQLIEILVETAGLDYEGLA